MKKYFLEHTTFMDLLRLSFITVGKNKTVEYRLYKIVNEVEVDISKVTIGDAVFEVRTSYTPKPDILYFSDDDSAILWFKLNYGG
jgi:hypothetical protein